MLTEAIAVLGMCVVLWAYQAIIRPPPPKICGSKKGPPITSPRIKLSDGRHLAYKERGVPKENARFKVIVVHGFDSSKDLYLPISQELIDELGIYVVTYDRAGYGESDPNPKRSVKSEAYDLQELADNLHLGPKFHVIGLSIGTQTTWACLKYIPHRHVILALFLCLTFFIVFIMLSFCHIQNLQLFVLFWSLFEAISISHNQLSWEFSHVKASMNARLAGVGLIVPVINFWWPSFPPQLCSDEYKKQPMKEQWKLRVAHYAPGLLYWWMTQKWFPSCSVMARDPVIFAKRDFDILKKMLEVPNPDEHKIRQQGEHESLYRDLMIGFGNWEFDPMELKNPFPDSEGCVQIWQGYQDTLVPFQLQRFLAKKLPWIKYYEVPDGGHLIIHDNGLCNTIFKTLLLKEEPIII